MIPAPAPAARWCSVPPARWAELLEQDPAATFAPAPDFLAALERVMPDYTPRFLAVEQGGELIGGLAAVQRRRGPWCWWHLLPFSLPGPALARPGRRREVDDLCAEALRAALRETRAAGGEWVAYRPGEPPPLEVLERLPGETRWMTAWTVDLAAGIDAAVARTDRETRRALRRLRERGVRVAADPAALDEVYVLHARQARGWPGHRALPLELSRRLLETGRAALLTVRDRGGLEAGVLALASPQEAFVWWSGARPETRASHAYAALLWGAAEWAAARGCRRLNLGASVGRGSVERFKRDLGAAPYEYPVRWLDASHAGAPGRALARLQAWMRRGRHRGRAA